MPSSSTLLSSIAASPSEFAICVVMDSATGGAAGCAAAVAAAAVCFYTSASSSAISIRCSTRSLSCAVMSCIR
jgi:hypothetical protein